MKIGYRERRTSRIRRILIRNLNASCGKTDNLFESSLHGLVVLHRTRHKGSHLQTVGTYMFPSFGNNRYDVLICHDMAQPDPLRHVSGTGSPHHSVLKGLF